MFIPSFAEVVRLSVIAADFMERAAVSHGCFSKLGCRLFLDSTTVYNRVRSTGASDIRSLQTPCTGEVLKDILQKGLLEIIHEAELTIQFIFLVSCCSYKCNKVKKLRFCFDDVKQRATKLSGRGWRRQQWSTRPHSCVHNVSMKAFKEAVKSTTWQVIGLLHHPDRTNLFVNLRLFQQQFTSVKCLFLSLKMGPWLFFQCHWPEFAALTLSSMHSSHHNNTTALFTSPLLVGH